MERTSAFLEVLGFLLVVAGAAMFEGVSTAANIALIGAGGCVYIVGYVLNAFNGE